MATVDWLGVMGRQRPPMTNIGQEPGGEARLLIAKQGNGPLGTIPLRFDAEFVRFDSLALSYHTHALSNGAQTA